MRWTVQRGEGTKNSTPGELLVNGLHFCWTLEPRRDQSNGKPFCIPADTYDVILSQSFHFQTIVPCLQNVKGFTNCEVHPGNYPRDTHGCTLVGYTRLEDFVGESKVAFEALVRAMKAYNEPIQIEYVDPA